MRPYLLTTWLVICVALPAIARQAAAPQDLAEGPLAILLTEAERAELAVLADPAARERFAELFWLRRDPDLGSRDNELRYEVETRVMAADNEFAEGDVRGALTPRGRVLVMLGVPSRHARMPIGDYLAQLYKTPPPEVVASNPEATVSMHGVTFNRARGMAEVWAYERATLPAGVRPDGDEDEVIFAFFDTEGSGRFVLQRGIRKAQAAEQLMAAVPAALLLHPDLHEAPVYSLIAGMQAATAEQLAVLDGDPPPWPEGASAAAAQGARTADDLPLWVLLVLPAAAPAGDTVIGRVLLEGDEVVGSFQLPVNGRAVARGTAYTFSLPAPEGPSRLDLALLGDGRALAVRSLDLEMNGAEGTFLSEVFAGAEVEEARDVHAGEPFVFGGYRLIPRTDGAFAAGESLALFCLVVRPGVNVDGSTDATVRMRWYVGGKPAPSAPPQSISLAPVGSEVYVWGTQLPLSALAAGSDYTLRVTVADRLSDSSRTTEVPIRITD